MEMNTENNKNGKRILLIRPYFEVLRHELGFSAYEPLGLEYIASAISSKADTVKIYDCLIQKPHRIKYISERNLYRCGSTDGEILSEIREFKPDIVCISGMFFSQIKPFIHVAELAKRVSQNIFVVGGGNFVSLYGKEILSENKCFDIIVFGNGEKPMEEIAVKLDDTKSVKGICYRDEKGSIIFTPPRNETVTLDDLSLPARDFKNIYRYSIIIGYNWSERFNLKKVIKRFIYYKFCFLPFIRNIVFRVFNYTHRNKLKTSLMPSACINTTRGCPNRCTFCALHNFQNKLYLMRSAGKVLEEIDTLVKKGVKEIVITDENFTVSRQRTIEICRGIIDRGYNIRLVAISSLYVPSLNKEVLEYLYRAGMRAFACAIENGNQKFLNNVIKKYVDLEHAKNIIAMAKKMGFHTSASFLFGYPGETKDMMLETLRFAFEAELDHPRFYILQPFPGTEVYKQVLEGDFFKPRDLDVARLRFTTDIPQVETEDFTKEDVKKIYDLANDILMKRNYGEVKDRLNEILGW